MCNTVYEPPSCTHDVIIIQHFTAPCPLGGVGGPTAENNLCMLTPPCADTIKLHLLNRDSLPVLLQIASSIPARRLF